MEGTFGTKRRKSLKCLLGCFFLILGRAVTLKCVKNSNSQRNLYSFQVALVGGELNSFINSLYLSYFVRNSLLQPISVNWSGLMAVIPLRSISFFIDVDNLYSERGFLLSNAESGLRYSFIFTFSSDHFLANKDILRLLCLPIL